MRSSDPAQKLVYLPLPTRALNALESIGVETVDDLCAKRAEELRAIPYFGTGQLAAVRSVLDGLGRKLAPPLPPPLLSARQAGQRARRQREGAMRRRVPYRESVLASWVEARRGQG